MAFRSVLRSAAPLAALILLGGCATVPGQDRLAEKDPLEKVNRGLWNANMFADRIVVKPVTKAYMAVTPRPARRGVSNFFANLTEPWSFVNNLLQGKPKRALHNLGRFAMNSTVGLGGLLDPASKSIPRADEDLGQTFAVWGINGGPYVVLPLIGPSTMRDGIGSAVAAYGDPINIAINQADISIWYKRGYRAAQIISARSEVIESGGDAFIESSLDSYAAVKSAFLQRRRAQILDQDGDDGAGPPDTDGAMPAGDASAAPLPGDEPAAAPKPAADAPQSSAPLPGDEPAPTPRP